MCCFNLKKKKTCISHILWKAILQRENTLSDLRVEGRRGGGDRKGEAPEVAWVDVDHWQSQQRCCYTDRFLREVHVAPHLVCQIENPSFNTKKRQINTRASWMSSICDGVRWDWTPSHPHVSQWGDIRVRQQDVGDDAHDFGGNWRLHQADVDHLAELLHHRLQLRVVQLPGAGQLTVHQLLDQVHDIGRIVWRNRTGRVNGGLKPQHLPREWTISWSLWDVYLWKSTNSTSSHRWWWWYCRCLGSLWSRILSCWVEPSWSCQSQCSACYKGTSHKNKNFMN